MSEFEQLDDFENDSQESAPVQPIEPELIKPEPEPEPTFEERVQMRALKKNILRYKDLFPKHLECMGHNLDAAALDELSINELQYLLEEVQICVNTRNSAGMIATCYFNGLEVVEKIGPHFGMRLNGLTNAIAQNKQIIDSLNEISLKYERHIMVEPEMRLAMYTAQTILTLHRLNKNSDVINNEMNKNLDQDFVDQFKDL